MTQSTRTWLRKTAERFDLDVVYVVTCSSAVTGKPVSVYATEALAFAAAESIATKRPDLIKVAPKPDSTELARWELKARNGRNFPALRLYETLVKVPYTEEEL